ncbi:MAG: arginine--tRNA ligase [Clostridiales bacterium]|jgi:arginyl-tRNA synthetase|nr:arginine--tRNA ligase [Clostridiales bacterium]
MIYVSEIAKLLEGVTPLSANELVELIAPAPSSEMGDWAFPCFRLSKAMKKSPGLIASDLTRELKTNKPEFIDKIEAVNGYVNFYLNRRAVVESVLTAVKERGEGYGGSDAGAGKTILIDYSSPNIAKHFHVGHLGTTFIGHALYNILRFLGYHVVGINYLGDWGTQFGKLITAYKHWGSKAEIEARGIDGLMDLYVKFHKEAESTPGLNDEARAWMLKMQDGDDESLNIWKWFVDLSLIEYERVYKRLNITFDSYRGESYYNDKLDAVVSELREKGLLTLSEGASIVDLSAYNMPPCLILRGDGGSLYPTRDIATALERKQTYDFYKSLYVTGLEQNLHFAQWMKIVEMMGYDWAKDMIHIPYGLVVFEEGKKISSRGGNVIKMEDLLDKAAAKTLEIINEKNPNLADKETVAEQVGIGAVIFNQLYNNRIKDVQFSWDKMLNFDGETGPYAQYTSARANSVLKKTPAAVYEMETDYSLLCDNYSYEVIKLLDLFPERIAEAGEKYEPFIISRYLVSLAQAFNKFYHNNIILSDDLTLSAARVNLTIRVRDILKRGLGLLGIAAPEEM